MPKKNTRPFAGIEGGLLELKLRQLVGLQGVDEIILSTNDEVSLEIAKQFEKMTNKLKVIPRPDELASPETDLTNLIKYVPELTKAEHILWTHVTSPFCTGSVYSTIIKKYFEALLNEHDSLVGVQKFKNFLWDPERLDIINRINEQRWPQTQDLKLLYEINNAAFLTSRQQYIHGNRLGATPFLFEMNKIESLDIDDNEDFKVAEAVYHGI